MRPTIETFGTTKVATLGEYRIIHHRDGSTFRQVYTGGFLDWRGTMPGEMPLYVESALRAALSR